MFLYTHIFKCVFDIYVLFVTVTKSQGVRQASPAVVTLGAISVSGSDSSTAWATSSLDMRTGPV